MPAGLALVLLAQAASADPAAAPVKAPMARQDGCANPQPKADTQQIVICAPKTDGYRLNPDVMEARREIHSGGRPTRPGPMGARPRDCAVGPWACGPQAGINLVGAALTAATILKKAVSGENVGQMFVTDPHPSEYQLYLAAKARREAREAEISAATQARAKEEEAARSVTAEPSGR